MKSKYYDIRDDLNAFPECWCFLVWSKRGPGKTYSSLRYMIENDKKFVFMKRTIKDVNMMCARIQKTDGEGDDEVSPFAPLNRDFGWNIYPFRIEEGLAGFYHGELDDKGKLQPVGPLLGWIIACSAVSKFKGFDMSAADFLIFDECIPKPWERVNHTEGDSVLDLYMTIARDRVKRGRPELKMLCLANATSLNNPLFSTLEVMDTAAEMDILNREFTKLDTGILLHFIPGNFDIQEGQEKIGIQKHMEGTAWGEMAFGGHFAYNDFTCIGRTSLKGYSPVCAVSYKKDNYYIYRKESKYYMCRSRHQSHKIYNLNRETELKLFYIEQLLDLREECIQGNMLFETFTMYDIIMNYKKYFSL